MRTMRLIPYMAPCRQALSRLGRSLDLMMCYGIPAQRLREIDPGFVELMLAENSSRKTAPSSSSSSASAGSKRKRMSPSAAPTAEPVQEGSFSAGGDLRAPQEGLSTWHLQRCGCGCGSLKEKQGALAPPPAAAKRPRRGGGGGQPSYASSLRPTGDDGFVSIFPPLYAL